MYPDELNNNRKRHRRRQRNQNIGLIALCCVGIYVGLRFSSSPSSSSFQTMRHLQQQEQENQQQQRQQQQNNNPAIIKNSVDTTTTTTTASSSPLLSTKRTLRRKLQEGGESLRVAAFGAGNSFGAGLSDMYNAYAYILSDDVHNYATLSTGPNYAATCLSSLIGDEQIYDLIFIDYTDNGQDGVDLVKRLHQRFPNAIIILLDYWPLYKMSHRHTNGSDKKRYEKWLTDTTPPLGNGKPTRGKNAKNFKVNKQGRKDKFQQDKGSVDYTWLYITVDEAYIDEMMAVAPEKMYRITLNANRDNINDHDAFIDALEADAEYYKDNGILLNQEGHMEIAQRIIDAMEGVTLDITAATTQPWDGNGISNDPKDQCHRWYTTGIIDEGSGITYSSNFVLTEYEPALHKHGLTFPLDDPSGSANITITNNLPTSRSIYLTYLVSQQDADNPDDVIYANVNVNCPSADPPIVDELITTIVSNTTHDLEGQHLPRTIKLGSSTSSKISGNSIDHTCTFTVDSETGNPTKPFYIMGITLSNEVTVPNEWWYVAKFSE